MVGRVDHSTFGARYAARKIGKHKGQMLAYCIAGHHSGLPDGRSSEEAHQRSSLQRRLDPVAYEIPQVTCPDLQIAAPALRLKSASGRSGFEVAFFIRMIFSSLVDADRLATEYFCDSNQADRRAFPRPTIGDLRAKIETFLRKKQSSAAPTPVNRLRASVLAQCVDRSEMPPGFFSLHVPTGGGKTYSSLAFALHHACHHDMRRVIYAIPFTSIIEQTGDAFRKAFGTDAARGLVEHHTDLRPSHDTRSNQFGTENWDSPAGQSRYATHAHEGRVYTGHGLMRYHTSQTETQCQNTEYAHTPAETAQMLIAHEELLKSSTRCHRHSHLQQPSELARSEHTAHSLVI